MTWLRNVLLAIIRFLTQWLVQANAIPNDIEGELGIDKSRPILYLLRTYSITDLVALKRTTDQLGLPDPTTQIKVAGDEMPRCLFLEQRKSLLSRKRKDTETATQFTRLFQLHREHEDIDLQIVPVSVFWGRAPGRASSGWSDLLADRASPSWLRKFFIVLLLGRDNFVCYSKAVSSRYMANATDTDAKTAQKLIRLARTHFQRRQVTLTGPSLLYRHQMYNAVLGSPTVKQAITDEANSKGESYSKAKEKAQKYIEEIASDYREGLIRMADRLLSRVWNKIYNGIEVKHADKVRELARNGHEIVYVPCHRSHMDYLLLSYVIYHEGLVTPHIAAGINLNFWPIGGIFRRGGAFFIRRTFGSNKLYTAVFREYLEQLFNRGYSVKFFAEGGRSRTGRLLPPKTGMLAMTLQAVLKGVNRPVSIVPVYIGYEHVMEVSSYLKELKGKSKEKESFLGVFSIIKKLKNYGNGFLNFGDPIQLTHFLDQEVPDWREAQSLAAEKKPTWLTPTVNTLANDVLERINQAAAINGMALISLCLLSAEKRTMTQQELVIAIDHYLSLLRQAPFSSQSTLPELDGEALLENTLRLNKLTVSKDSFGNIISLERRTAIAQTYYRNNILHLFAVPGLIAAVVLGHGQVSREQLCQLVKRLFPLLKKELFIYMDEAQLNAYLDQTLDTMLNIGLLRLQEAQLRPARTASKEFYSLWLLNRMIQETLQRYALVLTQLDRETFLSRAALEGQSRKVAERLSALHGISAPEFYDKNVLSTFINALKENQLLDTNEEGLFKHSEASTDLKRQIGKLISQDFVQRLKVIN